ncbi:MAG: protein kinase [bacterium]
MKSQTQNSMAFGTTLTEGRSLANRYQIREKIGEGGFAQVFEAVDQTLGRKVAIKLLKSFSDDAAAESRFMREAKFAAQIAHPDVVTIFDVGQADERPYIVMEFVQGLPLDKELWLHGPMNPQRAHRLFVRMLHAMSVAHENGVIHRDLKPSNLMLAYPNQTVESLRILDFGIAFYFGEAMTRLTKEGHFIGTPEYLAPEYIQQNQVSPALDVYQLGLIFVEMLLGRPLVALDTPLQCMYAHCSGKVQVPDYLKSSPIGAVLERSLAIETHNRYQNAGAFLKAMQEVDPEGIPSLPQDLAPDAMVVHDNAPNDEVESWSRALERSDLELTAPPVPRRADTPNQKGLWFGALAAVLLLSAVAFTRVNNQTEPKAIVVKPTAEVAGAMPDTKAVVVPNEESPAVASESGKTVTIHANPPEASIFVDDVFVDKSTTQVGIKADGRYRVRVSHPGFESREFWIAASTASRVDVDLVRKVLRPTKVDKPAAQPVGENPKLVPFD